MLIFSANLLYLTLLSITLVIGFCFFNSSYTRDFKDDWAHFCSNFFIESQITQENCKL